MTTKTIKTLLIALSSAFLLAGCDSVEALPQNYDNNIVVNSEDNKDPEIYKNIMGEIWTAINSGRADKVLEEFLKIVSKDQFGTWKEIDEARDSIGTADESKAKAFVKAHEGIFVREEDAQLAKDFQTTEEAIQLDRLAFFAEDVEKRINEVFYNEIKSGNYSKDNIFYEERLAWAHYTDLYDIDITKAEWTESYITPEFTKEDVGSMLHLDGRYDDYIDRKILPQIFKDKLVEEYLYKNNYATLGRAYARKVNIIKLTRDDKFKAVPRAMMEKYIETRIEAANAPKGLNFEELANAWRGFSGLTATGLIADPDDITKALAGADADHAGNPLSEVEDVIAKAAGDETAVAEIIGTDDTHQFVKYYKNTKLGILLDKYNIAKSIDPSDRWLSSEEESALSEFTGNKDHTIEYGLRQKLAELAIVDYTTDGWYVKNGGLSGELPDELRNRLFNIITANNVDSVVPEDAEHPFEKSNYVRNINGNYLLVPSKIDNDAKYNYAVYDSGSYYLVQVLEAPSTSKMNIKGDHSYAKLHTGADEALFTEKIAMEIAKVLGTKDSYINNAYASYIEHYSIVYHDSAVYDYFKSKFPELFEDD